MLLIRSRVVFKMWIPSLVLTVFLLSAKAQVVTAHQVGVVSLPESSTGAPTSTRYMLSYCKNQIKTLQLNRSLILELSNNVLSSQRNVKYEHCELKIRVEESKHILLQFFRLQIADTHGTPDRLKVYDSQPNIESVLLTPKHGAYGFYPGGVHRGVRDYNSTYNELELNYFGQPTRRAPGFKLLLTPYKREIARNKCPEGYFHCSIRHICIDSSLACDGYHNCGSIDESDEGKCSYYAETQQSPSFFEGATLLVFLVCFIAIIVFLGITLIICLLTRHFNKSSVLKLRLANRKRRRTQEYTSTNDLTQSYDPPSYEDVVRRNTDPPSYNITTPDTEDEVMCHSSNDKFVNNRRLDNSKSNSSNVNNLYMNSQSKHHNPNHSNKKSSTKTRNDYENLVQARSNRCDEEEQPLRQNHDHVYSCSVTIESPVSSSRARYSHRITNHKRNNSCSSSNSNSSSSNNMSDSNEFLLDAHGGAAGGGGGGGGMGNNLASRLSNGNDVSVDERLKGAVGCSPIVTNSPCLYPETMMPAATHSSSNVSPSLASPAASAAATSTGAADIPNGAHGDRFSPRRSRVPVAMGDDSESCDDDEDDDSFSQGGNLFSKMDNFSFADVEPSPEQSRKKHSHHKTNSNRRSNKNSAATAPNNSDNIFMDINSVDINMDTNKMNNGGGVGAVGCGVIGDVSDVDGVNNYSNVTSCRRNTNESKTLPHITNGANELNGAQSENATTTGRTSEPGGVMKVHRNRNRAEEECELISPQPESVKLLQ